MEGGKVGEFLLIRGDARNLGFLPDGCVQTTVCSPPYWGLRDYGVDGQLGLERTPDEYVAGVVGVFREVRRVLRDDGTLWLNIGDTYCSTAPGTMGDPLRQAGIFAGVRDETASARRKHRPETPPGLKPKDLVGIPWRLAFALQSDGWYLRSEIIWAKPNPMPESVTDRPTKAHEQVFLLSKRADYYYDADAIRTEHSRLWDEANGRGLYGGKAEQRPTKHNELPVLPHPAGANARTVWTIPTRACPEAHFATMPPDLAARCIKAGTSEKGCCPACGAPWVRVLDKERVPTRPGADTKVNGHSAAEIGNRDPLRHVTASRTVGWEPGCRCGAGEPRPCLVLDPFGGAGTTPLVAVGLGRRAIATELSWDYLDIARRRVSRPHAPVARASRPDKPMPLLDAIGGPA